MELFSVILNSFQLLTIVTKNSIFSCSRVSEAASTFQLMLYIKVYKLGKVVSSFNCNCNDHVFFLPCFVLHRLEAIAFYWKFELLHHGRNIIPLIALQINYHRILAKSVTFRKILIDYQNLQQMLLVCLKLVSAIFIKFLFVHQMIALQKL